MSAREDLYIILEVTRGASVNDVKKAFRRLARRYHPDINPGDRTAEERFKRISEAYEILGDPLKRQFYDNNWVSIPMAFSIRRRWRRHGDSVLKDSIFHVRSRRDSAGRSLVSSSAARMQSGSRSAAMILEYQMSIGFEESMRGFKTAINAIRRAPCSSCKWIRQGIQA